MPIRRWGKRKYGGELEFDKGVSIQAINRRIKDLGFEIYRIGHDEPFEFPVYAFRKHGKSKVKHKIKNSSIRVYALGDYSVEEWRRNLLRKLRETNPRYEKAATERERKKKRRREARKLTSNTKRNKNGKDL